MSYDPTYPYCDETWKSLEKMKKGYEEALELSSENNHELHGGRQTMSVSIEEAQDIYRAAWSSYLLTEDEDRREGLGKIMDGVQEHCGNGGPGPEWEAFIDTLPGFREHWERWRKESLAKVGRVFE